VRLVFRLVLETLGFGLGDIFTQGWCGDGGPVRLSIELKSVEQEKDYMISITYKQRAKCVARITYA
jgi:hypothetical protein